MKLIFMRHGLAMSQFSDDQEYDFQRKLTKEGSSRVKKITKSLKKLEKKIDVIFTSPLSRSVMTAEILWHQYKASNLEILSELDILSHPISLIEYISFLPADGIYAFVGHEPHLSTAIATLLSLHPDHEFMDLKKGGICVINGSVWSGYKLDLLLSPKALRELDN